MIVLGEVKHILAHAFDIELCFIIVWEGWQTGQFWPLGGMALNGPLDPPVLLPSTNSTANLTLNFFTVSLLYLGLR